MNILKPTSIVLVSFFLTGCMTLTAPWSPKDATKVERFDFPTLKTPTTARLGDTLVKKGYFTKVLGVEIASESCVGKCSALLSCFNRRIISGQTVPFNAVLLAENRKNGTEDAQCAFPRMTFSAPGNCGSGEVTWALCKDSGGWFSLAPVTQKKWPELEVGGELNVVNIDGALKDSFVQEFIYNGRYEDNLRFVYREFSDDIARPSFTQEVQYDLSEDNLIGFKELQMKILEATNTKITYVLITNF